MRYCQIIIKWRIAQFFCISFYIQYYIGIFIRNLATYKKSLRFSKCLVLNCLIISIIVFLFDKIHKLKYILIKNGLAICVLKDLKNLGVSSARFLINRFLMRERKKWCFDASEESRHVFAAFMGILAFASREYWLR